MAEEGVSLEALESTREQLIRLINTALKEEEKQFLLSFKNKTPDWNLISMEGVENLPAVKWKLINLKEMSADKHKAAYEKLQKLIG